MPNYIIRLKSKQAFADCCQHLQQIDCPYKKIELLDTVCLTADQRSQINQLIQPHLILSVEEDIRIQIDPALHLSNPKQIKLPWGMNRIGAVYTRIPRSYFRPKVAVLDTGLSLHPRFRVGRPYANFSEEETAADLNGHGTHIAGTIAGYSPGQRRKRDAFHGVYPQLSLYSVKAFNKDGEAPLSAILQGLEWCLAQKINIVNMSFGLERHYQSLYDLIRACHQQGMILVASSGNFGQQGLTYPAQYGEVISVGSTNEENQVSSFSQYGPELDLVAPGEHILSTWINKGYRIISGTSMACAHVSGVMALLLAARPKISPDQAKQILLGSCQPLEALPLYQGHGLVSIKRLIEALR